MSENVHLRICNKNFMQFSDEDSLGDIVLYTGGKGFVIDIQEDITPKESTEIMIMLTLGLHAYNGYDWDKIIKSKKLERHFKKL